MKLHKIFLFAATILGAAFSSCSKDDVITTGEQDDVTKPFVYLDNSNTKTFNLEPSAPTEFTFKVGRQNSVGAIDIPLIVLENTEDVFNVPDVVSFTAGQEEAEVLVTFPNAPIGKPCKLRVGFDPEYAGLYSSATREMVFTVNRVKWNSLGMGKMLEDFVCGKEVPVEILQRDDKPTSFRVVGPFALFTDLRDNASETIELSILQPKETLAGVEITERDLVYFSPTNTGYFHSSYSAFIMMYHPATFTSTCSEDKFLHNRVLSYQEDGKTPGQIQLAPYYYMDGVGGWNYTQDDDMCIITFPGFVPKYTANIESDFEYEEVFEGQLTSGLLGKSTTASLNVGTCVVTTDDCDKVFEETYGKIYKIVSPYAEDYHLTFLVKKGAISLPEGEDYELQATGLQALGKDVYAKINAGASKFEEDKVTLNITFTDAKGEVDYGTFDEVLENVKWESIGTGSYTDAFLAEMFGLDVPTYDVDIMTSEQNPGIYRVMNPYSNSVYPYAEDDCAPEGLYLTIDATDPNAVMIPTQDLGFDWGYGPFAVVSEGARYLEGGAASFDQLKKAGYFGTLKDGVITLPEFEYSNGVYTSILFMGSKGYYSGEGFKVVLPEAAANVPSMNAPAHMTGTKTLYGTLFEGVSRNVFTVRKDGKAPSVKTTKDSAPVMIEARKF